MLGWLANAIAVIVPRVLPCVN